MGGAGAPRGGAAWGQDPQFGPKGPGFSLAPARWTRKYGSVKGADWPSGRGSARRRCARFYLGNRIGYRKGAKDAPEFAREPSEAGNVGMKTQSYRQFKIAVTAALACIALGGADLNLGGVCQAQTAASAPQPPPDLPPALNEVVRLARAGLSEEVILAKIRNDGKTYSLTTDQIIYLSSAGISQNVITALLQAGPGAPSATLAGPGTTNAAPAAPAQAEPPPLDAAPASSTPSAPAPATGPAPAPASVSVSVAPDMAPAPVMAPSPAMGPAPAPAATGIVDNFAADLSLNPAVWTRQSDLLMRYAAVKGCRLVLPALAFGPAGMQMSGLAMPEHLAGVQSLGSFTAPFTFSATAVGMAYSGVPFEVSLVSADLRQWITVAAHLGGRGGGEVRVVGGIGRVVRGALEVPVVGSSPYYGVWLNYSGSGQPISSLGYKIYEVPTGGVPYTIQVSEGADGVASITLLNGAGVPLASRSGLPVGPGPLYVLLSGRGGATYANWQAVQMNPAMPVMAAAAPMVAAAEAPAVPATPTLGYFQDQLSPYGQWVQVPGAGLCWQPAVAVGWRPYYDAGHWVYTDEGWYWQSDYPWGDIAFHYGRWSYNPGYGWIWAPGYEFAPAWVVWRHTDDYCGWAPLPFGAVLIGGDWRFNGVRVGVDFDFGLSAGFFSFVAFDHFWEHDFRHFIVPRERLEFVFRRSAVINTYHFEHGHFVNVGLRVERVAQLSHRDLRDIHREAARNVRAQEQRRNTEERRVDHNLAKSGQKVSATRQVGRETPARNNEKTATRTGTERTGTGHTTSEKTIPERTGTGHTTSEKTTPERTTSQGSWGRAAGESTGRSGAQSGSGRTGSSSKEGGGSKESTSSGRSGEQKGK